jgi:hypothetical protein
LTQDVLLLSEPVRIAGLFDAKPTSDGRSWILSPNNYPKSVSQFDLRFEGFPNYFWEIDYSLTVNLPFLQQDGCYYLQIPRDQQLIYRIQLNNREMGFVWWGDYFLDITDGLTEGENSLEIRMIPYPNNFFESETTPLGIPNCVGLWFIPKEMNSSTN